MSQFGTPVPSPVSESTAIEIQRKEGTGRSQKVIGIAGGGTVPAGNIMKLGSSGLIQTVGSEDPAAVFGALLYQSVSGSVSTCIRGRVRAFWDGAGTVTPGSEIQLSSTYSGWVTGAVSGPDFSIGFYEPFVGGVSLAAANSGTLVPVELF
ncbi:MAG TPA: hypothetical protein VJR06_07855 [Nitrososphaerales archaeon]|nr:hypothetical protein [Nitrososphaerales archaeon]